MKPLNSFRRILKRLCMCRPDESSTTLKGLFLWVLFMVSTSIQVFSACASTAYFIRFVSSDLEACLNCVFQFAAAFSAFTAILTTFLLRRKVVLMFDKLADIYDMCKIQVYVFM